MRLQTLGLCFGFLATWCATGLAAEPVRVRIESCGGLDAAEVERILALEVAEVTGAADDLSTLAVLVRCDASRRVVVHVDDTLTDKRVERTFPAPDVNEPGRERVLALAISQLIHASWLELLVDDDRVHEAELKHPRAVPAARRKASVIIDRRHLQDERGQAALPAARFELSMLAGLRGRHLPDTDSSYVVGIGGDIPIGPSWDIAAMATLEASEVSRPLGAVDATAWLAGAGLRGRMFALEWLRLDATILLSAGFVRMVGEPRSAEAVGGITQGPTAQAAVLAGPTLVADPVRIGLIAEAGLMTPTPVGEVVGGEDVVFGGPWAGGMLRVSWAAW